MIVLFFAIHLRARVHPSRLGVDTPLPPQNDGGSKTAVASSSSSDAKAGAATATARSGERRGAPKPISFAPAPTPPGPPRASGANIAYAGLTSLIGISTVAATGAVIQPDFPLLIGLVLRVCECFARVSARVASWCVLCAGTPVPAGSVDCAPGCCWISLCVCQYIHVLRGSDRLARVAPSSLASSRRRFRSRGR